MTYGLEYNISYNTTEDELTLEQLDFYTNISPVPMTAFHCSSSFHGLPYDEKKKL